MRYLHLGVNTFSTGAILPLWATRPSLQFLALNSNGLAGNVPSSLFKLTSHEYLYNKLSEGIPNRLTKLADLKELTLNSN